MISPTWQNSLSDTLSSYLNVQCNQGGLFNTSHPYTTPTAHSLQVYRPFPDIISPSHLSPFPATYHPEPLLSYVEQCYAFSSVH